MSSSNGIPLQHIERKLIEYREENIQNYGALINKIGYDGRNPLIKSDAHRMLSSKFYTRMLNGEDLEDIINKAFSLEDPVQVARSLMQ